tara:strand:- start:484 stop:888 length:405 start_codon:yes stop_codon:yes gene_type:complete
MSIWDVFVNANKNSRDDSEIEHIEKQFLDIWAESHSASTIDELNEYETRAWKKWELIMDHYDYRCTSNAQRGSLEMDLLKSIDFESTGHPAPQGWYSRFMWKCQVFQNQRAKIERRNKSMDRMKFGNKNPRGRF